MAAVSTTSRQKFGWGTANLVVIALALIPVLWLNESSAFWITLACGSVCCHIDQ